MSCILVKKKLRESFEKELSLCVCESYKNTLGFYIWRCSEHSSQVPPSSDICSCRFLE